MKRGRRQTGQANARPAHATPATWAGALALAALVAALSTGPHAWAQTDTSGDGVLQMLEQQLSQQEEVAARQRALLADIRSGLAELSAEEQQTLERLDALQAQTDRLRGESLLLEQRLRAAEVSLATTESDVLALEARTQTLRDSVRVGLTSLYRERSGNYLALLSQSQTLPELLLRLRWANYLGASQVALTGELERQTQRLQARLNEQEQRREELGQLKAERGANLQALNAAQAETETLLTQLRQTAEGQRLLAVQGRAELQQTAANVDEVLGAMTKQREELETQRQRDLAAQQARAAEAARLAAESEAAQRRAAEAQAQAAALAQAAATEQRSPTASSTAPSQTAQAPADLAQAPVPTPTTAKAVASTPGTLPSGGNPTQSKPAQSSPTASNPTLQNNQAMQGNQAAQSSQSAAARQQWVQAQLEPVRGQLDNFLFPVEGGRVTETFSEAAPWAVVGGGNAVARAAEEGVVLAAATFNSLGWVVLLDHGGDLVSAYMGLQQPSVQVGDRLERGHQLGSIGGSPVFGPGAMGFQVSRVQGEQRTPLPYTPAP